MSSIPGSLSLLGGVRTSAKRFGSLKPKEVQMDAIASAANVSWSKLKDRIW